MTAYPSLGEYCRRIVVRPRNGGPTMQEARRDYERAMGASLGGWWR